MKKRRFRNLASRGEIEGGEYILKVTSNLLVILILTILSFSTAYAVLLFSDDFESGLSKRWIIANRSGQGKWAIAVENGNHFFQKTTDAWSIASVDGVGGLNEHKELWASCRLRADTATANEGAEVGLLINENEPQGNWYFVVRVQSGEAGFDELAVSWHSLAPYPSWKVGQWHQVKIAVINQIYYGKVWPDGENEPEDWFTQTTITNHLEEDGVGFGVDTLEVSFDDLVVADLEQHLKDGAIVAPGGKLTTTWGNIKDY